MSICQIFNVSKRQRGFQCNYVKYFDSICTDVKSICTFTVISCDSICVTGVKSICHWLYLYSTVMMHVSYIFA